jgi:hypothetical protein
MPRNLPVLDIEMFDSAFKAHGEDWGITDDTLYELCRKHSRHHALESVNAKALLIGRGFATGIERHITSSGVQGSSIGQLANHLHTNNAEVDSIIGRLGKLQEPLDVQALSVVVTEHGHFCELLANICRNKNQPASFASKYLHFHCPIVPIYDSWVYQKAWSMRRPEGFPAFDKPDGVHNEYYQYCVCFWQVYSALRALTPKANVRRAEFFLLWLANGGEAEPSVPTI